MARRAELVALDLVRPQVLYAHSTPWRRPHLSLPLFAKYEAVLGRPETQRRCPLTAIEQTQLLHASAVVNCVFRVTGVSSNEIPCSRATCRIRCAFDFERLDNSGRGFMLFEPAADGQRSLRLGSSQPLREAG